MKKLKNIKQLILTIQEHLIIQDAKDTLTVQLGASAVDNGTITGETSSRSNSLTAIDTSGFSSASYSGDLMPDTLLDPDTASRAANKRQVRSKLLFKLSNEERI